MENKINLLIFGPPGSGKGTQSIILSRHYNLEVISSGEFLRQCAKDNKEIKNSIVSGRLVDDNLVCNMLFNRLKSLRKDFLLDGFPRNAFQAKFLNKSLSELGKKITAVIELYVNNEIIKDRIKGRYICKDCSAVLNFSSPLNTVLLCTNCCSQNLDRRCDDNDLSTIEKRISKYDSEVKGLREYYEDILIQILGEGSVDEVAKRIKNKLDSLITS